MPQSVRFRHLKKELNRLKKQFIPKINPTGKYTDRQLSLTLAYRVLAHAEIESYLEDRAWEVALDAKKVWDSIGETRRSLICLVAFSGQIMDLPPDPASELDRVNQITQELLKIDGFINKLMK